MDRMRAAGELVGELEGLNGVEWRRLRGHRLFDGFMDEYLTAKCLTDFWWFLWWCLYHESRHHYNDRLFVENARWLDDWRRPGGGRYKGKFFIESRELRKTQMVAAWVVQQYARDRNQRAFLRAYVDSKAWQISGLIRRLIVSPGFRARFPWVRPEMKGVGGRTESCWRDDQFRLERDEDVRVPSLEAGGMKMDPTGGHYHLGIYDDYEVEDNANSESLMEEAETTFRNDKALLMAGSLSIFAGTTWSREGIIWRVVRRGEGFEGHEYDVRYQPAVRRVFESPFLGESPVLMGDRVTLRDGGARFPTGKGTPPGGTPPGPPASGGGGGHPPYPPSKGDQGRTPPGPPASGGEVGALPASGAGEDLVGCQVRVGFWSVEMKDRVEEVREVVWNDGVHFVVGRPFPEGLGRPLDYVVGVEKPAAMNVFTLDGVDEIPGEGGGRELTTEAQRAQRGGEEGGKINHKDHKDHKGGPGDGMDSRLRGNDVVRDGRGRYALDSGLRRIGRTSLPGKKVDQGSKIYNAQYLLNPDDVDNMVLDPDWVRVVKWSDLPAGARRWYRCCDFATAKKTGAGSSFLTGFRWSEGAVITHICYRPQMGSTAKILELLLGVLRVREWGGELEYTSFETANIEDTLMEFVGHAEQDPWKYFVELGDKRPERKGGMTYRQYGENFFEEGVAVRVRPRWLQRGGYKTKNDRIAAPQPMLQQGRVWIVEDCPQRELLFEAMRGFTMASAASNDILDTLADFLIETRGPVVREGKGESVVVDEFGRVQQAALVRGVHAVMGGVYGGGGEN